MVVILEPTYLIVEGRRHLQGYAALSVPPALWPHVSPGELLPAFRLEWLEDFLHRHGGLLQMEEPADVEWKPTEWVMNYFRG